MGLPTLILDFDGVIHSYTSGWKGPRTIPDPPVPGAMGFLLMVVKDYSVAIVSSRSHYWFGRLAMKYYIAKHMDEYLTEMLGYDCMSIELDTVMSRISFPKHKPPAILTIDDRAITFTGQWPSIDDIKNFKPWNKK